VYSLKVQRWECHASQRPKSLIYDNICGLPVPKTTCGTESVYSRVQYHVKVPSYDNCAIINLPAGSIIVLFSVKCTFLLITMALPLT